MRLHPSLLLPSLALTLAACGAPPAPEAVTVAPVPVEAIRVETGSVVAAYRGTATLSAQALATVVARTSGIIEAVHAEEGDSVRAGQPLAELDAERLALEAARARAQRDKLAADLERARRVHGRGLISNEQYEQLGFELTATRAAHELAALSVREAIIRAPFDGVISRRHIKVGNMIQSGQPAFDLVRLEPLEADLFLPERDLGKLRPGHAVQLRVDAYPGRSFAGRVARLSPVVDAATGTVKVTAEMSPGQPELKPGMFGRVEIAYDRRDNALRIPAAAVLTEDARTTVFVVEDGHAHRRELTLGYQDGGYYEVLEGLSAGALVVTTGQGNLKDNAAVLIVGATDEDGAPERPDATPPPAADSLDTHTEPAA